MSSMTESPEALYKREWIFNKEDRDRSAPPRFGVCLSGGGNRSAAFSIGVLHALHERDLLRKVDVMSAVSGGSYALSWLLLQPSCHTACRSDPRANLEQVQAEMFNVDGLFQRYLADHAQSLGALTRMDWVMRAAFALLFDLTLYNVLRLLQLLLLRVGTEGLAAQINASSTARLEYREGIQQTYQVFGDPHKQVPMDSGGILQYVLAAKEFLDLTASDVRAVSFPALSAFAQKAGLPSFVFNTTVAPPRPGDDVPLKERVFELGSIGFGSDSCGYLTWEDTEKFGWEPGAKPEKPWLFWKDASPYATIRSFNTAPAISGAAIDATNINQSRLRFLLKLINLGLAYWVPNPADPRRVVRLSDGGHSENLGAYALLRRRCRNILIVDAEYDPSYSFGAYRKLRQALKQEARQALAIDINVPAVEKRIHDLGIDISAPVVEKRIPDHDTAKFAADMPMAGTTTADGKTFGNIFYLKLSMSEALLGDQAEIIKSYAKEHDTFPQESTIDQYFGPDRFGAYRGLGYAIGKTLPRDLTA